MTRRLQIVAILVLFASFLANGGGITAAARSTSAVKHAAAQTGDAGALRPITDPRIDPAATLKDAMTFASANDAIAGPFTLSIDQRTDHFDDQRSNVQVQDFIAQFTYATPPTEPAGDSYLGMDFWYQKEGGDVESYSIYLHLNGQAVHWAFGQAPHVGDGDPFWMQRGAMPVGSADVTPGADNEFTVVVYHGYAMVTGNTGEPATVIQLPGVPQSGDVFMELGFYAADPDTSETLPMAAQNFRVWDLSSAQMPALGEETTPESSPAASTATAALSPGVLDLVFARQRAAALAQPRLEGPISGEIQQASPNTMGTMDTIDSTTSMLDFYATATFVNPEDMFTTSDIGIGFRDDYSGNEFRFVLQSSGSWWLTTGNSSTALVEGTLWNVDAAPGASNTIEVIASGATGLVAVNGVVLPQLDLSSNMVGDAIFLFTGMYMNDRIDGRSVLVKDFQIYPPPT